MSEAKIAVKVVANRFVTVYPMVEPKPEDHTFPQQLSLSKSQQAHIHRQCGHDDVAPGSLVDYVRTRQDQQ